LTQLDDGDSQQMTGLVQRVLERDQNTLSSNLEVAEGHGVGVDEVGDE
jgi:hypothetical protein